VSSNAGDELATSIARTEPTRALASVAVIIPCFNDGATLAEAIRSAQAQTRLDELIVVDDGSTDHATLEILSALEAEAVAVVHRLNGGPGAARMSGVRVSQADYILALDADDRLLPGALDALAEVLDQDEDVAIVWGDYQLFGDRSYRQRTASVLDPWQISYQDDLPVTALIRRSALLAAGGWGEIGGYEDWSLWMGLAECSAEGRRVEFVVYEYRQHGVRSGSEFAAHHEENYARLRSRHSALFAHRLAAWRRSRAPLALRLALPVIFVLPISANRRRLLAGAACHLAHGRGVRLLLRRARVEGLKAASPKDAR
jgi:glycosyltransferase involved in cell wall biosynthesis